MAAGIGLPLAQVFKTLVVRGDRRGVLLAVLAGDAELDLKALARLSGDRRVELVPLKKVQPLTGYIRGGVTALACKKDYPVFADESIQLHERVAVSAGMRGRSSFSARQITFGPPPPAVGPIARRAERCLTDPQEHERDNMKISMKLLVMLGTAALAGGCFYPSNLLLCLLRSMFFEGGIPYG